MNVLLYVYNEQNYENEREKKTFDRIQIDIITH